MSEYKPVGRLHDQNHGAGKMSNATPTVITREFETLNNSVTLTGTWDKHLNLMHVHAYVENDGGNWSATKYFASLDEAEQHYRSRLV